MLETRIAESAKIYPTAVVRSSVVSDGCCVADGCDLLNVAMAPKSEFGRRSLVRDAEIGYGSYTGSNTVIKNCVIGKFCSISWNLSIGGVNHNYRAASTYTPYWWKRVLGAGVEPEPTPRSIIGNDVWVGAGTNILAGVKVGDGAVIGAGALVNKDVPPYAVWGGVPARLIRFRFDEETVGRLLALRWWSWPIAAIAAHSALLSGDLTEEKLLELERVACSL